MEAENEDTNAAFERLTLLDWIGKYTIASAMDYFKGQADNINQTPDPNETDEAFEKRFAQKYSDVEADADAKFDAVDEESAKTVTDAVAKLADAVAKLADAVAKLAEAKAVRKNVLDKAEAVRKDVLDKAEAVRKAERKAGHDMVYEQYVKESAKRKSINTVSNKAVAKSVCNEPQPEPPTDSESSTASASVHPIVETPPDNSSDDWFQNMAKTAEPENESNRHHNR